MEFRHIPVADIRKWWASIKAPLDQIKGYSPEDWIVEDVYADLISNRSLLWVALKEQRFGGFFILQQSGLHLHVWAAWTLENDYQMVEDGLKYIKGLASQANAKYVTFSSHRQGWQRRAKQLGFRPKQWICEV
jgi:hypothetical protein